MNTTTDDNMKAAAEAGDIDHLYRVIQDDPSILERIDSIPLVETPLHIAASRGHLQFATEVMMLKSSFAWKLNQQGFSPIHLAMQNNQKGMVLRFMDIDKNLVRIKGREGLTPLHLASQVGEIDLLANFLFACPESIEEMTVRCETALHIAVKNEQYEALQVLVGWLKTNTQRGARKLEYKILNRKDEAGNTILHVSAQNNQSQALQILLKTRIKLKARNLENSTALDMAGNAEIKSILVSAGAKPGSKFIDSRTRAHKLRSIITILDKIIISMLRIRRDMSDGQRNALLIVATLVVTATYQSALSPPGGVYQISAGENNVNTTSLNSTTTAIPRNGGKSILSKGDFIWFSITNMVPLLLSIMIICILTPVVSGSALALVYVPVEWFVFSYLYSMETISPTRFNCIISSILIFSILASWIIILLYSKLQRYAENRKIKTRATRGNI